MVVDDETACDNVETIVVVGSQVGIADDELVNFNLYPNPATTDFDIQTKGNFTMTVYNGVGELVLIQSGNDFTTVSCSDWSKGFYTIEVSTEVGTSIKKLIVQ